MSVREKFHTVLWMVWTLIVYPVLKNMKCILGHTMLRRIFISSMIVAMAVALLFLTGIVQIRFVPNVAE